ncbi:hypothetical protein H8F21_13505 [Pseudomonas sp. P66]|uniref:Uncharacterized protein n=1 Tax=Pseudomonas arcuscaelestis TaxID=2710591 RepID=A0ABS2BY87_9PSED|nr:hypothetical protein [Pseudomonas arcuscaelestis]MBM5458580.1 hypothetical protein [Pseudomonas arcuscaelestis]
MAIQPIEPAVHEMRTAAELAVFRLYGFLGAGARLHKALDALVGTQTTVACPIKDSPHVFKVSVLERRPGAPLQLQVVHAPDYDGVHERVNSPPHTPGHWTAILEAAIVNGPFTLAALTVEGRKVDLNTVPEQQDSNPR